MCVPTAVPRWKPPIWATGDAGFVLDDAEDHELAWYEPSELLELLDP